VRSGEAPYLIEDAGVALTFGAAAASAEGRAASFSQLVSANAVRPLRGAASTQGWRATEAAVAAHVLVPAGDDCHGVRRELEQMLDQRFGIEHTTL
jgi:hypothetical protein